MRNENRAVLTAIRHYRDQPSQPPKWPPILLAATCPPSNKEARAAASRRPRTPTPLRRKPADGRHEDVDSGHFIQAE
jgi:hypothetical protein